MIGIDTPPWRTAQNSIASEQRRIPAMPNYYAHLSLGAQVLSQLPQELSLLLNRERSAFDLGCLGPDPLFFYRPTLPNPVRREGVAMHARVRAARIRPPTGGGGGGRPHVRRICRRFSVSSGPGQCLSRLDRPQGGRRDRHSPGHGSRVRPPADGAGRPGITGTFLPPSHALRARCSPPPPGYQHTSPRQLEEGYQHALPIES